MKFNEDYNDLIEEDLEKLSKFDHVECFDILVEEIMALKDNEQFIQMGEIPKTGFVKKENNWKFSEDKVPFINAAKKGLSTFNQRIYYPPLTKVIYYKFFKALYTIIQLNYMYYSGEKLSEDDYKSIILGDVGAYLTYFVEDFQNPGEIPKPSQNFFKGLKNIKYDSKEVENFNNRIYWLLADFVTGYDSVDNYGRTIGFAVTYLMGCSALKRNHDVIVYDDVVTAYLTICKLFKIDIRPLVKKGYENYDGYYSDKI
jgi:hypothetical protein